MMAVTHAAVGAALGSVLLLLEPSLAPVAILAGAAGGLAPDLDLLIGTHRRTLHFPALGWLVALPAVAAALFAPTAVTVGVALFFLSAALHAAMDVLGGGTELRPWERRTDRAVYLHPAARWLQARRVVRYDGAPEDLGLTVLFALPGLLLFDGPVHDLTVVGIVVATVYTLVRKRLPSVEERLFGPGGR